MRARGEELGGVGLAAEVDRHAGALALVRRRPIVRRRRAAPAAGGVLGPRPPELGVARLHGHLDRDARGVDVGLVEVVPRRLGLRLALEAHEAELPALALARLHDAHVRHLALGAKVLAEPLVRQVLGQVAHDQPRRAHPAPRPGVRVTAGSGQRSERRRTSPAASVCHPATGCRRSRSRARRRRARRRRARGRRNRLGRDRGLRSRLGRGRRARAGPALRLHDPAGLRLCRRSRRRAARGTAPAWRRHTAGSPSLSHAAQLGR